ncbi:hypothetical protein HDU96_005021 [Phlyctochytrium bullatum]|nr:hypothetical protein HDU96_005021 [Phlyctochytrium bullatum]
MSSDSLVPLAIPTSLPPPLLPSIVGDVRGSLPQHPTTTLIPSSPASLSAPNSPTTSCHALLHEINADVSSSDRIFRLRVTVLISLSHLLTADDRSTDEKRAHVARSLDGDIDHAVGFSGKGAREDRGFSDLGRHVSPAIDVSSGIPLASRHDGRLYPSERRQTREATSRLGSSQHREPRGLSDAVTRSCGGSSIEGAGESATVDLECECVPSGVLEEARKALRDCLSDLRAEVVAESPGSPLLRVRADMGNEWAPVREYLDGSGERRPCGRPGPDGSRFLTMTLSSAPITSSQLHAADASPKTNAVPPADGFHVELNYTLDGQPRHKRFPVNSSTAITSSAAAAFRNVASASTEPGILRRRPVMIQPAVMRKTVEAVFDVAIALAYFSIPIELLMFLRKTPSFPYSTMVILFCLFITSCGLSHLAAAWTQWFPIHVLVGVTALVSCFTAVILYFAIPTALRLPMHVKAMETEIFERMLNERRLQNENTHMTIFREIVHNTRSTLDKHVIIDTAIRDICAKLNAESCFVLYPTNSHRFRFVAKVSRNQIARSSTTQNSAQPKRSDKAAVEDKEDEDKSTSSSSTSSRRVPPALPRLQTSAEPPGTASSRPRGPTAVEPGPVRHPPTSAPAFSRTRTLSFDPFDLDASPSISAPEARHLDEPYLDPSENHGGAAGSGTGGRVPVSQELATPSTSGSASCGSVDRLPLAQSTSTLCIAKGSGGEKANPGVSPPRRRRRVSQESFPTTTRATTTAQNVTFGSNATATKFSRSHPNSEIVLRPHQIRLLEKSVLVITDRSMEPGGENENLRKLVQSRRDTQVLARTPERDTTGTTVSDQAADGNVAHSTAAAYATTSISSTNRKRQRRGQPSPEEGVSGARGEDDRCLILSRFDLGGGRWGIIGLVTKCAEVASGCTGLRETVARLPNALGNLHSTFAASPTGPVGSNISGSQRSPFMEESSSAEPLLPQTNNAQRQSPTSGWKRFTLELHGNSISRSYSGLQRQWNDYVRIPVSNRPTDASTSQDDWTDDDTVEVDPSASTGDTQQLNDPENPRAGFGQSIAATDEEIAQNMSQESLVPNAERGHHAAVRSAEEDAHLKLIKSGRVMAMGSLLSDLAEQVGIALQQATLVAQVRLRIEQLAEKNDALMRARKEVKVAQAQKDFTAVMSHEMRTPLFAISALSSMVLEMVENHGLDADRHRQTEEIIEMMRIVKKSGDMLVSIVNNILDFAKYEEEPFCLDQTPFVIREAIETAAEIVAIQDVDGNFPEILTFLSDSVPEVVVGDKTRFKQILVNLLSNACKFTQPSGEVVLRVDTEPLQESDHGLEQPPDGRCRFFFDVTDTGIGIRPEHSASLFEKFTQADASITRKYGGTGLGLAIAKRLSNLMQGEIGVCPNPEGQGTRFYFHVCLSTYERENWDEALQPRLLHLPLERLRQITVGIVDRKEKGLHELRQKVYRVGVKDVIMFSSFSELQHSGERIDGLIIDYQTMVDAGEIGYLRGLGSDPALLSRCAILTSTHNQRACRQERRLSDVAHVFLRPLKFDHLIKFLQSLSPFEAPFEEAREAFKAVTAATYFENACAGFQLLSESSPSDGGRDGQRIIERNACDSQNSTSETNSEMRFYSAERKISGGSDFLRAEGKSTIDTLYSSGAAGGGSAESVSRGSVKPHRSGKARKGGALSILVVEDNRVNQMVIGKMLLRLGQHCDMAENGVDALDKLALKNYDVVFMGVNE